MPSGVKSARLQVMDDPLAGDLLGDRGAHVRGEGVVQEVRPRLVLDRVGQESARPLRFGLPQPSQRLLDVPGRHRQQVANPHRA